MASSEKLITPEFRGSFVHVFKPHSGIEGAEPKYSITIPLRKKEDAAFIARLEDTIEAIAKEEWGKVPPRLRSPIADRDEDESYPEFAGCVTLNAKAKRKPGVVVLDNGLLKKVEQVAMETGEDVENIIYSGAIYRASIVLYTYDVSGAKGVAVGLNNLMKVGDGEPLSGGGSAERDFTEFGKPAKMDDDSAI